MLTHATDAGSSTITSATLLLFAIAGVVGGVYWSCSRAGPRRWAKHRCAIATEKDDHAQVYFPLLAASWMVCTLKILCTALQVCDGMKSATDAICGVHGDNSAPCKVGSL